MKVYNVQTFTELTTPADLPEISVIERELTGGWTAEQLRNELNISAGWSFVIRSGDHLLGYIFGVAAADEAEINKIAIAADYRRRGLANRLLTTTCRYLAGRAITSCFLEVRQSNIAAQRLYNNHHFKQIGIRKNYYTSPVDNAILLKKEIISQDATQFR